MEIMITLFDFEQDIVTDKNICEQKFAISKAISKDTWMYISSQSDVNLGAQLYQRHIALKITINERRNLWCKWTFHLLTTWPHAPLIRYVK